MWLRRWVGLVVIVTFITMNIIVVLGLFSPRPKPNPIALNNAPTVAQAIPAPTISLSISPSTIPAGTTSALSWTTTGNPSSCTASGHWSGAKTPFGSESTGRLSPSGNYTFTLECRNAGGKASSTATITVGNALPPKQSVVTSSTPSASSTTTYCGGRTPCYGTKDVAAHSSSGDCWGWNIDRIVNVSTLDSQFHQARSGVSSITTSQICGHDIGPALSGSIGAGGLSGHVHQATARNNSDANMAPYYIGYYDSSKK